VDFQPGYGYDPRVVFLEGKYYVIWCCDFSGASLGLGVTEDFKAFTRLENPSYPTTERRPLPAQGGRHVPYAVRPSDPAHTPFATSSSAKARPRALGRHRK